MNRILPFFFSLALILLVLPAHAIGDHIVVTQDSSGAITAALAGAVNPCAGSNLMPIGTASVSRTGNQFDIIAIFAVVDPITCPSSSLPYAVPVSLGVLPDGQYTVAWKVGPLGVRGEFGIRSGLLVLGPNPIPALGWSTTMLLITMIAFAAIAAFAARRKLSRS